MASQDTSRKVLAHAAALVGIEALAERFRISERVLRHYLTGYELIPDPLFLQAVDVIIERLPQPGPRPQATPQPDERDEP